MLFTSPSSLKKDFPVTIKQIDEFNFRAECPLLPGCVSQGKTKKEAFRNLSKAIELFLKFGTVSSFEVVYENPQHPRLYSLRIFNKKLYCSSSHDGLLFSDTGEANTWKTSLLT